MIILGLTGPIASGKTTVAGLFAQCGATVINADELVHLLQGPGTTQTLAVAEILGVHVLDDDGALNRSVLGRHIAKDPAVLGLLESIFHPAVRVLMKAYLEQAEKNGAKLAVLDVPLLFETGLDQLCDATAVCVAKPATRRSRAFERPEMSEVKWEAFHKRRLPEQEIFKRAGHHLQTDGPLTRTQDVVTDLYQGLVGQPAKAWPGLWADVPEPHMY